MEKKNGLIPYLTSIVASNIDDSIFEQARSKKYDQAVVGDLAQAFADAFLSGNFRFGFQSVLAFNGKIYERIEKKVINVIVSDIMKKQGLSSRYFVQGKNIIADHCSDLLLKKEFDPCKTLISLNNGVLDINTFEFDNHDECYETTVNLNFDYDKDATCPLFEKFLKEVLPDKDVRDTVQEIFGMVFVDRNQIKYEKLAMFLGTGSNGKSVLFDAVNSVLGNDNVSNFSLYDLTEHPQSDYNRASFNGKLLNYCSDMDKKDASGGMYKRIISGEPVPARFPCEKPFTATMIPIIVVNINTIPNSSDSSHGHYRRNLIIPFNRTFSEKEADKELPYKISKEKAGIFNWIIEGTKRLRDNKGNITGSDVIDKANDEAKVESNSILSFFRDNNWSFKDNGNYSETSSLTNLYEKYKDYCKSNGMSPFGINNFHKLMKAEGATSFRISSGNQITYWVNPETVDNATMEPEKEEVPF